MTQSGGKIMSSKTEFLNAKGLELVELKKTLATDNELIRNALKESVKTMKLKSAIKLSLVDDTSVTAFVERLMKEKAYVNHEKVYEVYGKYTELLKKDLKKRKILVQFDTNVKEGVMIVKRFGAQAEFAKRHFKMTDEEFETAKESGFIDTYMKTLALSMKREFNEKLLNFNKKIKSSYKGALKVKLSDVYLDEETGYYNVDIEILLIDYTMLDKTHQRYEISVDIKNTLESLQGAYFRRMN